MAYSHYRLDKSGLTTVALCSHCDWRTITATPEAADLEAESHMAVHLTPKQLGDWRMRRAQRKRR